MELCDMCGWEVNEDGRLVDDVFVCYPCWELVTDQPELDEPRSDR